MKKSFPTYLVIAFICLQIGEGSRLLAQENLSRVFVLDTLHFAFDLTPHVAVLEDPSKSLSLEEVVANPAAFRPRAEYPVRLDPEPAYWAQFSIRNTLSVPSDWMLHPGSAGFTDVFISDPDSGVIRRKTGSYQPYSQKDVWQGVDQRVRLHLEPGEEKLVFIRMEEIDHRPILLRVNLLSLSYWKTLNQEERNIIIGVFQGMVLIIILYNLILFFTTGISAHLYYALYLMAMALYVLFISEMLLLIPSENPVIFNHVGFMAMALVSIFYFQFGRSFLDTEKITPKWDLYLSIYIWIKIAFLIIEQLILFFTMRVQLIAEVERMVIILDAIVNIFFIFRLLQTRIVLARFFIAGSSLVLVFAFVLTVLSQFTQMENVLPLFLLAVVIEILIFSLGLGYRIRSTEQEKLRAQEEKLKAQEEVNLQLLKTDRMKDEFLANTSHELRTPLNGIIGIAESIKDGAVGEVTPEIRKNLSMIVTSGRRLTNLVNDLLDFSKLKSFDIELQRKAVDLHSLTDVVLRISEPLLAGKPITLLNEVPESLPAVDGDENRLQQILLNLVGNAIKFTDAGSVKVTASPSGDLISLSVIDTGIGIEADKTELIFQTFEQGDGSVARKYGGTGLGLSITRQLVELHGGTIHVASTPGQGSTFTFTLPVSAEEADPESHSVTGVRHFGSFEIDASPIRTQPVPNGDNVQILIVDDEPINLQVIKNHLSFANYQVTSALNGEDALKSLQEQDFNLVLLDVMMPRMSGYEVCQKIRETYLPSELPVIMITAKNQVSDLVQGLSYGANDYLTKPFSKDEFLARIKTHLRLYNINNAYGRFVPKEFIRAIGHESILDVSLGDQSEREVTVLFSDIRSYTTLSETMTPAENFEFMNAYLGRMGPIIQKNNGFVSQYYGDGIMALFLERPEDALHAAIEMHEELAVYNEERKAKKRLPIRIGVGIHTGSLMLGIIGDRSRMEAGVVSDTVNTTSRMEGLTKHFGCRTLVSEGTVEKLDDPEVFKHRFLGRVLVKGKKEPLDIYDFYEGDPPQISDFKSRTRRYFEEALELYFGRNFQSAAGAFKRVLTFNPHDSTSKRYLLKCNQYMISGVPKNWTGVETMSEK